MPYLLSHRQKTALHIIQLLLVHVAIGFSVPRMFMKNQPRTRANTIAMGMGAKSIMLIFYQILTENVQMFKRWASLKANMIINCLEVIFWAAVVFLVMQANLSRCTGISCTLSWVVVGVSILIVIIQIPCAIFSVLEFRESRKPSALSGVGGVGVGVGVGGYESGVGVRQGDEEMVQKSGRARERGY
ncbi:hypothetical protein EG328_012038 [Venturia inaequalis]|uniref:Uncharacterized protein n=1 Tax=Venturia inaequalis TaxID=5025 RepID=A0A8H3VLZ1_VENIN|nr:hypothetical protein EG328_012038 [Venturia inaequalis]KAE9990375.1 hypothetical protein EG327_001513 [Venturia inaequalis]